MRSCGIQAIKQKKVTVIKHDVNLPAAPLVREPIPPLPPLPPPPAETKKESVNEEAMDVGQMAEAFSAKLQIEDIDELELDNPQLCAEYAKDIYTYMRELEQRFHVKPDYMSTQPEINERMRCILVDWLIQVHHRFSLLQETLYLTISIIDRYLATHTITKSKLQLVGVTAMLLASKYEEMYAPEVRDFAYITDNTYKSAEIRVTERQMLKDLDYSLGNPLPLHFLRRNSRAADATPEMHTMAKFLMELCLPDFSMLEYVPSLQAASALYLSIRIYGAGDWSPTLQHYSTYSESQIMPCVRKMAKLVTAMASSKQQAIRNKYSSSKFLRIAKEPRLSSSLVMELASGESTSGSKE